MTAPFTAAELERFRALIASRLGLNFDDSKSAALVDVLRRRVDASRLSSSSYLAQLEADALSKEVTLLALELTVPETYFFRSADQLRAFAEIALPARRSWARSTGSRISVVSAGCASGEEPYSLAMTIRDAGVDAAEAVTILGVDINSTQLERATRARYSAWALRETPADLRSRWFKEEGRDFLLDPTIRSSVRFEQGNLADERLALWRPQSHDIIFCRNVLMYFERASAEAVVSRFARSLRPGGYLFLGHAETLRGLSNDFHLRHTHGTFYYQRRDRLDPDRRAPADPPSFLPPTGPAWPPLSDIVASADTWIATIQQASDRIRSIVDSPQSNSSAGTSRARRLKPVREIGRALELLKEERFAEALDVVTAFPEESQHDSEVLLLRAVLQTHSGQLDVAERTCERLLAINELNAEAHYLLALCREGVNDRPASVYHDQVAVYLDPSFAMAHLHLGLLARRAHDLSTARRELEQAIALLHREDASRLLLFGGGFGREALIDLCRRELVASGGRA